jgi:hypothetical protein
MRIGTSSWPLGAVDREGCADSPFKALRVHQKSHRQLMLERYSVTPGEYMDGDRSGTSGAHGIFLCTPGRPHNLPVPLSLIAQTRY